MPLLLSLSLFPAILIAKGGDFVELNENCAKDLLLYVADNLTFRTGSRTPMLKLKLIRQSDELMGYSDDELVLAARILAERGYVLVLGQQSGKLLYLGLKDFRFLAVTDAGLQFLEAVKNPSTWAKLKKRYGKVFQIAAPVLLQAIPEIIKQL